MFVCVLEAAMLGVFLCGYLLNDKSVEERDAERESLDIIIYPCAILTQACYMAEEC